MKKPLAICALALLAVALYAQDAPGAPAGAGIAGGGSMLDVKAYVSHFGFNKKEIASGEIDFTNDYALTAAEKNYETYAEFISLGKDSELVDTPLEFALLSYYSPPVINIRPAQAAEMLPANDPRTAGLKLGAAVLKELTELRFLDPQNTAAIARYEGMLQFISDKSEAAGAASKVSRAEIDNYYRQGIGGLIAGAVDEEFKDITVSAASLTDIKQRIRNFYLTPNQTTFNALKNKYNFETFRSRYDLNMSIVITRLRMEGNINSVASLEEAGMTQAAAAARESIKASQDLLNTLESVSAYLDCLPPELSKRILP